MAKLKEIYVPVLGYEGLYEVSNIGNVKSLGRLIKAGYGSFSFKPCKIMKKQPHNCGYEYVSLKKDGTRKSLCIHRLVLEAFRGVKPEGLQCRHLNGNRKDNRLENLCWGTAKENTIDKVRHSRASKKLKKSDIIKIRKLKKSGLTSRAISKKFNVTEQNIYCILKGKIWNHV